MGSWVSTLKIFLFLPQQYSPAVLHPSSSLVVRHQDSKRFLPAPGTFRQDLYNHAKLPHPSQSHVVIYIHTDAKHDSRSGGCESDLPNCPFSSPWSHFTRQTYSCTLWAAACVISLTTEILNPKGKIKKDIVLGILKKKKKKYQKTKGMNPSLPPTLSVKLQGRLISY